MDLRCSAYEALRNRFTAPNPLTKRRRHVLENEVIIITKVCSSLFSYAAMLAKHSFLARIPLPTPFHWHHPDLYIFCSIISQQIYEILTLHYT